MEVIKFMHSKQIVHRDIKTQNVMLDENFEIKLIDFGYSSKYNPEDLSLAKFGTDGYMSPQMVSSNRYNPFANDIFSLGVLLFELVNGFPPMYKQADKYDNLYKYFIQN